MEPTFHIITKGYMAERGFFIGVDSYQNIFSIPKNIILQNNIESIGNKFPCFCLSHIEKFKSDTSQNVNRNIIADVKLFLNIVEVIQYVFDFIKLDDKLNSNENYLYLTFIKSILFDYDLYKEKSKYLNKNSYGYNRIENDLFYNNPDLLLSTDTIFIKEKVDKYMNFYGYDYKTFNFNKESKLYELRNKFSEFEEDSELLLNLKKSTNYVFKINLFPLYYSYSPFKKDSNDGMIKKDVPYMEIVTLDVFKKFNINSKAVNYFDQFYKLKNENYNFVRFEPIYELDERIGFRERLKTVFNHPYVYSITPVINLTYFDKSFIEKMHKDIIAIIEDLHVEKISNIIILPPFEYQFSVAEYIDNYLNPPDDGDFNSYDGWVDLANQEMRKWDDETDGFWRIENDFG